MLVLHRRTEDLLAFLPGTEVQTLQPVMNSAGHQFRVEFPIRIPGHVDIQSTPRIRQSEITDTPTQWFLLVRLMPRHQKKTTSDSHRFASGFDGRRAVQVGQKKAGMLEALGSSLGMARRSWFLFVPLRPFGNEMGEPPHICLSELIIASVYPAVHETLGPEVEVGPIVLGGWRYHAPSCPPLLNPEDFLVGFLAGDQHVDVVEQCHRAFRVRDVPLFRCFL